MPIDWVAAEKFLTHRDVTVYHVYKNDEIAQGPRTYWYGWREDSCDERDSFDVRELPNTNHHNTETNAGRKALIRESIDAGILTEEGVSLPEKGEPVVVLSVPQDAWRVLEETLLVDARSSAFDADLRDSIRRALARVVTLNAPAELLQAARGALEWAEQTGGWDAPCWQRLKTAVRNAGAEMAPEDVATALRRIFDILYLDMDSKGEFHKPDKDWNADTLSMIADIVRPLFPLTQWTHSPEQAGS